MINVVGEPKTLDGGISNTTTAV